MRYRGLPPNNWLGCPLVFLQSTNTFTLPVGLVSLQGSFGTGSISIVLAGVIIALVPE